MCGCILNTFHPLESYLRCKACTEPAVVALQPQTQEGLTSNYSRNLTQTANLSFVFHASLPVVSPSYLKHVCLSVHIKDALYMYTADCPLAVRHAYSVGSVCP